MDLAIFDLDNTLLDGDSDNAWGQFLVDENVVDREFYERENLRFYDEYKAGTLDIHEFLNFALKPLADNDIDTLHQLRQRYLETIAEPMITPSARKLVEHHRKLGHTLLIITATNRFVTEPIAERLGIDNLIATEPEQVHGRYTGRVAGTPSFREGKIERMHQWLKAHGYNLASSWFYSDSHNDLPLLEEVNHPVVVNGDETLSQHADYKGWPHISLRHDAPDFDPAVLTAPSAS